MLLLYVLLGVIALVSAGATYDWHVRRHLPHDMRHMTTEGLPNEASIRSGELGLGTGSQVFRNWVP